MTQRILMEQLKDYNCTIDYHPSKADVVVHALSRKATWSLTYVQIIHLPLMVELRKMRVELRMDYYGVLLASFQVQLVLIDRI